jgi:hypothetical protein
MSTLGLVKQPVTHRLLTLPDDLNARNLRWTGSKAGDMDHNFATLLAHPVGRFALFVAYRAWSRFDDLVDKASTPGWGFFESNDVALRGSLTPSKIKALVANCTTAYTDAPKPPPTQVTCRVHWDGVQSETGAFRARFRFLLGRPGGKMNEKAVGLELRSGLGAIAIDNVPQTLLIEA